MYLECTIKTQLHTTVDKYNKVSLKKKKYYSDLYDYFSFLINISLASSYHKHYSVTVAF
jgi:hypothetical protein